MVDIVARHIKIFFLFQKLAVYRGHIRHCNAGVFLCQLINAFAQLRDRHAYIACGGIPDNG